MLAKPEWNPDRFEDPKKSAVAVHNRSVDLFLMVVTLIAGTSLVLAGFTAFL
ncbi:MAG: hypothetical protein ABL901_06880 [Hyphomicrobiaceae bacterium]